MENEQQNDRREPVEGGVTRENEANVSFEKIPVADAEPSDAGVPDAGPVTPTDDAPVPDMPGGVKSGSGNGADANEIPPEYVAALSKEVPEVPTVTQKDLERQVRSGLNKRVAVAVLFIGAIMISALLTFYLTSRYYNRYALSKGNEEGLYTSVGDAQEGLRDVAALAYLLDQYAYYAYDFDKAQMMQTLLKAYVAATGDRYATFHTAAEYAAIQQSNAGASEGIGVTTLQEALALDGKTVGALHVVDLTDGSPAKAAGLAVGDRILAVLSEDGWLELQDPTAVRKQYENFADSLLAASAGGEDWQTTLKVEDGRIFVLVGDTWRSFALSEDSAVAQHNSACLNAIRGEAGTDVTLRVMRDGEIFEVTVTRGQSTSHSVLAKISETDPKVGIVTVMKFDLTTPEQFKEAMNTLIGAGAERFVLDLRDNPGGQVYSVTTILSYFLNRKDLILTKVDRDGKTLTKNGTILAEEDPDGAYTLTREEIGMYRDYPLVLLVNGNTASAAEIMTSVLRDYDLATVVGEKTYGKGIMQTTESSLLNRYGISGAVTFTFCSFLPPSGESFHGVGIAPDAGYEVALPADVAAVSVYVRNEADDPQMQAAIRAVLER